MVNEPILEPKPRENYSKTMIHGQKKGPWTVDPSMEIDLEK